MQMTKQAISKKRHKHNTEKPLISHPNKWLSNGCSPWQWAKRPELTPIYNNSGSSNIEIGESYCHYCMSRFRNHDLPNWKIQKQKGIHVGVEPKIVVFPPKSSIFIGFSIIFAIHFGVPLFLG